MQKMINIPVHTLPARPNGCGNKSRVMEEAVLLIEFSTVLFYINRFAGTVFFQTGFKRKIAVNRWQVIHAGLGSQIFHQAVTGFIFYQVAEAKRFSSISD